MPKKNKDLRSFFGRARGTNAQAPAAVPPPADAAPDDAAAPPQNVVNESIAEARASAAAPDDVPSAAAGAEEVNDDPMEVEEETADPMEAEDGAGADRKVSACLKNEADEGNEAEAGEDDATSPGGKHDRDDDDEKPRRAKRQRDEGEDDSEEEKKLPPVPSSPEEYADVARRWYNQHGGAFTSESTRRPPANSSQHDATYKYLYVFCVAIATTMLVIENLILLPSGILFGFINFSSDLLSMNSTRSSYIYYLFWPDSKGRRRNPFAAADACCFI
ncbi:hypothetical protein THAOC_33025, partial [Thalassiosira oceanica]